MSSAATSQLHRISAKSFSKTDSMQSRTHQISSPTQNRVSRTNQKEQQNNQTPTQFGSSRTTPTRFNPITITTNLSNDKQLQSKISRTQQHFFPPKNSINSGSTHHSKIPSSKSPPHSSKATTTQQNPGALQLKSKQHVEGVKRVFPPKKKSLSLATFINIHPNQNSIETNSRTPGTIPSRSHTPCLISPDAKNPSAIMTPQATSSSTGKNFFLDIPSPKSAFSTQEKRFTTTTTHSTFSEQSKFSRDGLNSYLAKATLLNECENKLYSAFNSRQESYGLSLIPKQSRQDNLQVIDSIQIYALNPKQNESFFFSAHNFYYFTVVTKARPSPFKLSVKIKSPLNNQSGRIKGYFSKTANHPNTFNADYEFDGRSMKLYANGGKKVFGFDQVYFSLYPEFDMTVKISISFGEDTISEKFLSLKRQKTLEQRGDSQNIKQQSTTNKHKQSPTKHASHSPIEVISVNQSQLYTNSVDEIQSPMSPHTDLFGSIDSPMNQGSFNKKQDPRFRLLQAYPPTSEFSKDIVEQNKQNFANVFDKYKRTLQRKSMNAAKIQEVLERKEQINHEQMVEAESKLKMSKLRLALFQSRKIAEERNYKFQLYQQVWAKFIKQSITFQLMNIKMTEVLNKRKLQNNAKMIVIRLASRLLVKLQKTGKQPEKRALTTSSISLNQMAATINQKCTARAENIVSMFIMQTSQIQDIKMKGLMVVMRVTNIQRQWRETKLKKKRFKELIVRQFQQKYSEYLFEIRQEFKRQKDPFYQPNSIATGFPIIQITDYMLLSQVIQIFLDKHLIKYYQMYERFRNAVKLRNLAGAKSEAGEEVPSSQKNFKISISLQRPSFFRLPKEFELRAMVKDYAIKKQLLN